MRPLVCKGHTRPMTCLKYNREGDLLISCAKDKEVCLFFQETGERIGTYVGHEGSVYTCDISWDSSRLVTASADSSFRLWELDTGKELCKWALREQCRACCLAVGDRQAAFTADPFSGSPPRIHMVEITDDPLDQSDEILVSYDMPTRINRIKWTDCNRTLLTGDVEGCLSKWDVETGKLLHEVKAHGDAINDMRFSVDDSHFVTASLDKTAKLIDTVSLEVLKEYKTEKAVNAADISPLYDHIVLGGGQDASEVTTTAAQAGQFESKFYHKIYAEEFGSVRGHFGPINTVAFHPSGRGFSTGGEDGFVRIHHFDDDYFTTKFF
ncbi:hypothetical protein BSKO_13574 [Bryopsis sp. KO-2023]|nr:hypothetical protein BSKO_13574 [Bryopsis sp. KO-2023]